MLLLVDSNHEFAELAEIGLRNSGLPVLTATSIEDAVVLLNERLDISTVLGDNELIEELAARPHPDRTRLYSFKDKCGWFMAAAKGDKLCVGCPEHFLLRAS